MLQSWGINLSNIILYSSENAVNYLTAWGVEIDAQDNTGSTPLHYAAQGVVYALNVHIIMSLLIGGASRSVKVN